MYSTNDNSASKQATIVVQNIQHLLNNESLDKYSGIDPAGIHMTLGLVCTKRLAVPIFREGEREHRVLTKQTKNIVFRNPIPGEQPHIKPKDDG